MKTMERSELLKNQEIVEEIKRHCWIESEKAGYDIGFDQAASDWINRYAETWLKQNQKPEKKKTLFGSKVGRPKKKTTSAAVPKIKKRRAKSY